MQWALRKKRLPEILVKARMSLYEGSKTKFKVGSEFLKEFYVAAGVHQRSVLSPLLFAILVDVVTENAREGLMKVVLYADNLVLISAMMRGFEGHISKIKKCIGKQGTEDEF